LQKNKHYFNQIIPNINTISENTANVAKDLKKASTKRELHRLSG
jgi:hypothetical protein